MSGQLTTAQATHCARASLDRFITRKQWGSAGDATLLEYAWLDGFLSDDEMKKFFQSGGPRKKFKSSDRHELNALVQKQVKKFLKKKKELAYASDDPESDAS